MGEQFLIIYSIRKRILVNSITNILFVNFRDVSNFRESINSVFQSKFNYYVEIIIFCNVLNDHIYEILSQKAKNEDKVVSIKVIFPFSRKIIKYTLVQQILIGSFLTEENTKYINIMKEYSIVPLNWINNTVTYLENNNNCDWIQYKKSNVISENTGIVSKYFIMDTINMLKNSQAIHVCFRKKIVGNINFMSYLLSSINYVKALRNYLLDKKDIRIHFIEKTSKKCLEKLEL